MTPREFEGLLQDAGYPTHRVSRRRWHLRVETGVEQLHLELSLGPNLCRVRTRGYLQVPPKSQQRVAIALADLQRQSGLARFEGNLNNAGQLIGVEVAAALPHEHLSQPLLREFLSGVIEAAVWYSARLQALALGLPIPPPWPPGKDPSLGLRWIEPV